MNITYDYYRIFYYVVKCGSFTKAAEILGNSQPNITRSMNNLEAQTGLKLFVRSKYGVRLTPEGEQLYEHVKVAFFHLTQAEEEMEKGGALKSGNVIIGVSEIALHEVLLPKLALFHKKYPGVKIQLTNQSTPETIASLKKELVHFALVTSPFEIHAPFQAKKLLDFKETLVAGNEFCDLKNRIVELEELKNYPWVSLMPGTATRDYYDEFFAMNNIKFEPQFMAATMNQVLPMIKAGLGIGFVPSNMVDNEMNVFEIQVKNEPKPRSVYLITDTEHPLSAAAIKLIEMIG